MNRQEANRKILAKIEGVVNAAPDLRFWQMLLNMNIIRQEVVNKEKDMIGIKDDYHIESERILENITKH